MHRGRNICLSWVGAVLVGGAVLTTLKGEEQTKPIPIAELLLRQPLIGSLGKVLGERTVIEGVLAAPMMLANPIAVEKVDGRALAKAENIEVRGVLKEVKEGVHYKLEGYESGGFEGPPEWVAFVQQPFVYRQFFIATRVIEPAGK